MKITKKYLRQVIREELDLALIEEGLGTKYMKFARHGVEGRSGKEIDGMANYVNALHNALQQGQVTSGVVELLGEPYVQPTTRLHKNPSILANPADVGLEGASEGDPLPDQAKKSFAREIRRRDQQFQGEDWSGFDPESYPGKRAGEAWEEVKKQYFDSRIQETRRRSGKMMHSKRSRR